MNNPPFSDDDRYDALVRRMRLSRVARVFLLFLGGTVALLLGFVLAPLIGPLF